MANSFRPSITMQRTISLVDGIRRHPNYQPHPELRWVDRPVGFGNNAAHARAIMLAQANIRTTVQVVQDQDLGVDLVIDEQTQTLRPMSSTLAWVNDVLKGEF